MLFKILKKEIGVFLILALSVLCLGPVVPAAAEDPQEYTVRFDNNDGSGTFQDVKKPYNQYVQIGQPTTTHEDFDFVGWAQDPQATRAEFTSGNLYRYNEDITLYAIWYRKGADRSNYLKTKRTISAADKTYTCGKTVALNATVKEGGTLKYTSGNTKILKLDANGVGVPKSCGIVKVTISAAEDGLYAPTSKTITLTIKPSTPKVSKISSPRGGLLSCSWKKCKGVTGYQIYIGTSGRTTYLKWKKTSFTASAKSKAKYSVKIRAYKKSGSKTIYGKWSKVKKLRIK